MTATPAPAPAPPSRLETLAARVASVEAAVREIASRRPPSGAGDLGLSATERVARIIDPDGPWLEIGALRGHDRESGAGPGAGIVTGIGTVGGRPVMLAVSIPVADGLWHSDTVAKLLRAQEIALRQRIPIVHLLAGGASANEVEDGWFPGHYGPSRALALASAIRRIGIPQLAVAMGPLQGAAALLTELAGDPVPAGPTALTTVRERLLALAPVARVSPAAHPPRPALPAERLAEILPADHRRSYDMMALLGGLLDGGELTELQPRNAPEMICGHGAIEGMPVAVIANRRGVVPAPSGPPRLGGIIYTGSAAKVAFFIETASRQGLPILFVQDVSGFMLGVDAEHSGIIRAGADLVEAMATAKTGRIALTINHASGAGYYAMASQGFEPDFTLTWPTGRIGAMEAESAITAAHGTALAKLGGEAAAPPELKASIAAMRRTFERDLEATHAAARGHVDAIVTPANTRPTLAFLLRVTARTR